VTGGRNLAYRRGTEAEKRTARRLEADGYHVTESRGSHGVADLVALKRGQVLLVQVKTGNADDGALADGWWNDLYGTALRCGAVPVVADWPKRGTLRLRRITGPHNLRSHRWPCEPFITDEAALDLRGRRGQA
jgi:Holliday junction resolvase